MVAKNVENGIEQNTWVTHEEKWASQMKILPLSKIMWGVSQKMTLDDMGG